MRIQYSDERVVFIFEGSEERPAAVKALEGAVGKEAAQRIIDQVAAERERVLSIDPKKAN